MKPYAFPVRWVAALAAATSALMAYLLFVSYRDLVTTGDAHLQRWVSPQAARWIYLGLVVALAAAMSAAARVSATAQWEPAEAEGTRPWRLGAAAGLAAGAVAGFVSLLTAAFATHVALLGAGLLVAELAAVIGPLVVGVLGARATGRTASGALAGMWFGVLLALSAGLAGLASDTLFAARLAAGPWLADRVGDITCNRQIGKTLIACELGDTAGVMAFMWLVFPLLGAAAGAVGGLTGRLTTAARLPALNWRNPAVSGALLLGITLLATLAAEITFQIW
jgi:hypothetical protein